MRAIEYYHERATVFLEIGTGMCGKIRNTDKEHDINEEGSGLGKPPCPCTPRINRVTPSKSTIIDGKKFQTLFSCESKCRYMLNKLCKFHKLLRQIPILQVYFLHAVGHLLLHLQTPTPCYHPLCLP